MDNKNYNQEEIFDIFRIKEPHTMEMWNQEWDSEYRSKNIVDIMKLHYMDFATEAPTADSKTVKAGQRQEKRIMIRGHDADGDSLTFHM